MKDTYVESENWYFINGSMISVKYPKEVARVSLLDYFKKLNQSIRELSSKYAFKYNFS